MTAPLSEIHAAGITVLGTSLAGEETLAIVPEMNLAFDIGRAPRELIGIDHVFLTHGHMDHSAGVAYYFSQRMFIDNKPGNLYLPDGLADPVRRLLSIWADIDGQEPAANIHVARPGDDIRLRRDLIVRPFQVDHPSRRRGRRVVHALGYAAIEVRKKLKPEYRDLTGPQIVELKRNGTEIEYLVEIPLVAYCGDTAPGAFLELEYVRRAKVLLLECTFVEPDHLERARAGSHMHISYLRSIVPKLENERIILTHLSRRTSIADAKRCLRAELGAEMDERVCLLMDQRRRGRRHANAGGRGRQAAAARDAVAGNR